MTLAKAQPIIEEPEIYTPTFCFRCQQPIYLKPLVLESGYVQYLPYNYHSNSSRHHCSKRLEEYDQIPIKNVRDHAR